jgi:preprotein translocase subunit SecG
MTTILTVIHISVCLFLVGIVLLQHGKGAAMGATFGGSSQTMFGTEGPLPLLNKVTTAAAVIFMVTSISLAYISAHRSTSSLMSDVEVPKPTGSGIERAMETVPDMPLQSADSPLAPAVPAPGSQKVSPDVVEETAAVQMPAEIDAVAEDLKSMAEELAPAEIPAEIEAVVEEVQEQQGETAPAQQ